ncbi:MAG: hypothetical protein ACRERE_05205 [Candidatus Entotheonellia bacterium]
MKLGHGRRIVILLVALLWAVGTTPYVVSAASMTADMMLSAGADGTQHSSSDGCSNPDMGGEACKVGICAPGCGAPSACATLPTGAVVRPAFVLALPESAFVSLLGWLISPDPPPPRPLTQET